MIYLDSSVALAHLLAEAQRLPDAVWNEPLTSSRLLEYEVWNRLHAKGLGVTLASAARAYFEGIDFVRLTPKVLARALDPYPVNVRTLDGLHLATVEYLRGEGESIELATFDYRMIAAARALDIAIYRP
jgi:hypothetical protein